MKLSAPAVLALLLSLGLALCLPLEVRAAAIPINNAMDLQNIKVNLGADYYLAGDIDASATKDWNNGAGFEPIGTSVSPFTGQFDGNGHVITGLTINRPFQRAVGLFGFTSGASIQNIGMQAAEVTGLGDVGGLVGSCNSGHVTNCYTTGSISAQNTNVGGMLGVLNSSQLDNAYSQAAVSNAASNGGGLVGRNYNGTILNCYSTGAVSGAGFLGGLVGSSSGATTTSSYWDRMTSGQNTSAGGQAKSTPEMMQKTTYVGWNDSIWSIRQDAYPALWVFETGLGTPPPGDSGTASVPSFTPYGILVLSLFIIGSKIWLVGRKNQRG